MFFKNFDDKSRKRDFISIFSSLFKFHLLSRSGSEGDSVILRFIFRRWFNKRGISDSLSLLISNLFFLLLILFFLLFLFLFLFLAIIISYEYCTKKIGLVVWWTCKNGKKTVFRGWKIVIKYRKKGAWRESYEKLWTFLCLGSLRWRIMESRRSSISLKAE